MVVADLVTLTPVYGTVGNGHSAVRVLFHSQL